MQINQTLAEASNPLAAASSRQTSVTGTDTFLKLLVAQLRYQNPAQPADGIEFVSQLAQFTSLEQMTAMRQSLDDLRGALVPAAKADTAGAADHS